MPRSTYSDDEVEKFLREVLNSELACNIYKQLVEDGGNTAMGISENLQAKGLRGSKTRVYEEISTLLKLGLIKRVSNRPPIYTTVPDLENFERIARLFFMDTREELMRRWAATYPFLPEEMRSSSESNSVKLQTGPIVNFNPYPVIDVFNIDNIEDLRRYLLRVFESNIIQVSHSIVDICVATDQFRFAFQDLKFEPFIKQIRENYERFGKISTKTLTNYMTNEFQEIKKTGKLNAFQKQFFNFMDYESREPTTKLSSFVIGKNNLLYPIGIGGINTRTFVIIEIRDKEIINIAQEEFETAWETAKILLKIEDGNIV